MYQPHYIIKPSFSALLVILASFVAELNAQSWNTIAGARFGDDLGFMIGQRLWDNNSVQLLHEGGFSRHHQRTYMHVVNHMPLLSRRFNLYAGIGGFAAYQFSQTDAPSDLSYGPTAILGLDFTIGRLNVTADWMPTYTTNTFDGTKFYASSGVTLRYVLIKRKSRIGKWWNRMKHKLF